MNFNDWDMNVIDCDLPLKSFQQLFLDCPSKSFCVISTCLLFNYC